MLFIWESDYLKGYRQGVIAVDAVTLAEARSIAAANFDNDVAERHYCGIIGEDGDFILSDWEREDYENYKAKFQADIAKEPQILELDAFFMYGGD